jgi:ribosomal protein S18 acetylase RimI-like enzyme
MGGGFTIRNYTEADWESVCTVHDRARPMELSGSTDARGFRPMVEEAEEEEFFDSRTFVACDGIGGRVIGFVSFNGAYITWLYVDPDFHRRGIGSALLDEALKHCGPQAWVNTMGGNAAAIAMYRKAGFDLVKSFPSDCDGYPCTCLQLALPTSRMHDPAATRDGGGG